MSFVLLDEALVERLHDAALNPGELSGRARDKSLGGALARVEHRLAYGPIEDVFDLAAMYAVAVAQGHCFNDANKRTAYQALDTCLVLNGVRVAWDVDELGPLIVSVAQGQVDEAALAAWPRGRAPRNPPAPRPFGPRATAEGAMTDTTVTKVSGAHSPRGPEGEVYLASGKRLSMRLWRGEEPTEPSMRRRDYETVGYVVAGRAELVTEGQTVRLEPGDSWVVPAGAEHGYRIIEAFTAVEATAPPAQAHGRDG